MKDIYNYEFNANYLSQRDGDIKDSILSNKKTVELISNYKSTSINDGVKKLREDYLQKGEIYA